MGGLIHVGAWDGREYIDSDRRLLLFEPQAEPFAALQANLVGVGNDVEVVNLAIGAEVGEATMHTSSPSHSSSLLAPSWFGGEITFDGTETVQMTTLDLAMDGRNGFDVLRIDTQGYELEVLKGAEKTLRKLRRVELEVHNPDVYSGAASLDQLDEFLVAHGFSRTELAQPGLDDLADVVYERG